MSLRVWWYHYHSKASSCSYKILCLIKILEFSLEKLKKFFLTFKLKIFVKCFIIQFLCQVRIIFNDSIFKNSEIKIVASYTFIFYTERVIKMMFSNRFFRFLPRSSSGGNIFWRQGEFSRIDTLFIRSG